jgi:hypothetical protein
MSVYGVEVGLLLGGDVLLASLSPRLVEFETKVELFEFRRFVVFV